MVKLETRRITDKTAKTVREISCVIYTLIFVFLGALLERSKNPIATLFVLILTAVAFVIYLDKMTGDNFTPYTYYEVDAKEKEK